MISLLKKTAKIQILCILVLFFSVSQASAVSCQSILSEQWHSMSLFYGSSNMNYRSALRRFNIHEALGEAGQGLSPREKVSAYFQEIDQTYTQALEDDSLKAQLKDEWLNRALITSVPESYITFERRRAREDGHGDINVSSEALDRMLAALREAQESSFLRWFDYIMGPDITVPAWLRYILLEDLLKLGIYNEDKKTFSIRNDETAGPYPELNSEAFGEVYSSLENFYMSQSENIDAINLELIHRDLSRSFANIYGYYTHHYAQLGVNFDLQNTEGQWVRYNQGNEEDAQALFNSLQEQNTGWCTAASCNTANTQVQSGDFYVYYSEDFDGNYTVPRIAIRMQGDRIAEVRGRSTNQNLDPDIIATRVLDDKLQEFGSEGDLYKRRSENMRRLTQLETKVLNEEELSRDDLRFLYEIDETIQGFGYNRDPRINEILDGRDPKADISFILNIRPDQVSLNNEEALSGGIIYHHGDLDLQSLTSVDGLVLPQSIKGSLDLSSLTSADGLVLPQSIGGSLDLGALTSADGLVLPQSIGGSLDLGALTSADGLVLPQSIGESLLLSSLTGADGLVLPELIGGSLSLSSLTGADGLVLPQSIGSNLFLRSLTRAEGLVLPQSIGGSLMLSSLANADGVTLPQTIGGKLGLRSLTSADGLVLPQSIGGSLNLGVLTNAEGLIMPQSVGGDLNLRSLTSSEGLVLPQTIGGDLDLRLLASAEGLVLPHSIGGSLGLRSLTSAVGLTMSQSVGGTLDLYSLSSGQGLILPETVGGSIYLEFLRSAEGLTFPKAIGADLILRYLTSAEGLTLPQSIGGSLTLTALPSADGLVLPQSIGGSLDLGSVTSAVGLILPRTIGNALYLTSLTSVEGLTRPESIGGQYLGPAFSN